MANQIPVTKTVVVEDSVTQQAGEGITANHAQAIETPDIFDNTAQPAVKQTVETIPAEAVAVANARQAGENVTLADVSTEGSTVTTPSDNINPNGVANVAQATPAIPQEVTVAKTAVVEDSVTHQAGEGITAGMSSSLETPDIFDNTPQAVVKTVTEQVPVAQTTDGTLVATDSTGVPNEDIPGEQPLLVATDAVMRQQQLEGENNITDNLQTLSDGTVDIPRD